MQSAAAVPPREEDTPRFAFLRAELKRLEVVVPIARFFVQAPARGGQDCARR